LIVKFFSFGPWKEIAVTCDVCILIRGYHTIPSALVAIKPPFAACADPPATQRPVVELHAIPYACVGRIVVPRPFQPIPSELHARVCDPGNPVATRMLPFVAMRFPVLNILVEEFAAVKVQPLAVVVRVPL
jgi:hypothetical protein